MKIDRLFGVRTLHRRPGINSGSDSRKSVETDYLNNPFQWVSLNQTPICNRGRRRGDRIPIKKSNFIMARLRSLASYGVPVVGTRIEIAATRATPPHKKQRRRCRYPDHYVSTQSSVVAPGEGNHREIAPTALAVLFPRAHFRFQPY
jgi:hypothetical protein